MTGPLLVIAHEATRTGSPRVLAELLSYLAPRLTIPLSIELLAEGPLASELRSHASIDASLDDTPVAVMVNSAAAAGAVLRFGEGMPALAYVHEQGEALEVLPEDCRKALCTRFLRVLCVSDEAAADVVRLGVPVDRVAVLPPVTASVPAQAISDGHASSTPLVIGCGEAGWRKGADLFVDVARRIGEQRPACFEWAGRRPRAFARVLDNDTAAVGCSDRLTWLGELGDLSELYRRADLLVMTSREDPRPLVPLEAAGYGVATAAFAVGGLHYLAERGAVATVPYPDTTALAELVADLLDDGERRHELARTAAEVASREHSIAVVGPRFVDEVTSLFRGGAE